MGRRPLAPRFNDSRQGSVEGVGDGGSLSGVRNTEGAGHRELPSAAPPPPAVVSVVGIVLAVVVALVTV